MITAALISLSILHIASANVFLYQNRLSQPKVWLPFTDDPNIYHLPAETRQQKTIPICDYWKALGVQREECQEEDQQNDDFSVDKQASSFEIGLPACRLKFFQASCVETDKCASGIVCLDLQSQRCCRPLPGTCPTPSQMNYKCKVFSPVSWCTNDADCKGKKCCPTGCNYNICA